MAVPEVAIKFSAVGAKQVVSAAKSIGSGLKRVGTSFRSLVASAARGTASLSGFSTKLLLLPGALVNVGKLVKGLVSSVSELTIGLAASADSVVDTVFAFEKQIGSQEKAAATLAKLTKATEGQVSSVDLMRLSMSNLTADVGLTEEQLATLLSGVKASADAFGKDLNVQVEAVRRALATGAFATLAAVEGFEGLTPAIENAREAAREAGRRFTKLDQIQIGVATAVELARKNTERWGGSTVTASDIAVRFQKNIKDVKDTFLLTVGRSEELRLAFEKIGKVFGALFGTSKDLGTSLGEIFTEVIAGSLEFVTESIPAILSGIKFVAEAFSGMVSVVQIVTEATANLVIGLITGLQGVQNTLERIVRTFAATASVLETAGLVPEGLAIGIINTAGELGRLSTDLEKTKRTIAGFSKSAIEGMENFRERVERVIVSIDELRGKASEALAIDARAELLATAQPGGGARVGIGARPDELASIRRQIEFRVRFEKTREADERAAERLKQEALKLMKREREAEAAQIDLLASAAALG